MDDYQKEKPYYLKHYEKFRELEKKLKEPTGRAIIVFEKS
jgi:hypothetical protein